MNTQTTNSNPFLSIGFCLIAAIINVSIGAIVKALNLPLYFDSVGTILATLLLGWRWGATAGVLSFVVTSVTFNPFAIYFIGTQVAIAILTHLLARNGGFKNVFWVILSGVGIGVVAAIVSAPVIIWVFGGATGNGASVITSMFVQMGNQIMKSVFLSGFSIEPVDKVLQCLMAYIMIKGTPKSILLNFTNGSLQQNRII